MQVVRYFVSNNSSTCCHSNSLLQQTNVVDNNLNPQFDSTHQFLVNNFALDTIYLEVVDGGNVYGAKSLGSLSMSLIRTCVANVPVLHLQVPLEGTLSGSIDVQMLYRPFIKTADGAKAALPSRKETTETLPALTVEPPLKHKQSASKAADSLLSQPAELLNNGGYLFATVISGHNLASGKMAKVKLYLATEDSSGKAT